jgi:hypothetical protein
MSDEDYIRKIHKKNTGLLSADRITIRVVELERIIKIAYNDGAADALESMAIEKDSAMPSFMKDFFSGLKTKVRG